MTTRNPIRNCAALFVCALAFLAGCDLLAPGAGGQPTDPAGHPLAGTTWYLISYGPVDHPTPAVPGAPATLEFGDVDQVAGSGGCNSYGGVVEIRDSEISFSNVVSTLIACSDARVMDQETGFFDGLNTAERYTLSEGELIIFYANGQALRFSDSPPALPTGSPAPTAADTATPTATPDALLLCSAGTGTPEPGWERCENSEYGFLVMYPDDGELTDHTATSAQISLAFTPGTNLIEKYLEISVAQGLETCTSPLTIGYAAGTIPRETVTVEDTIFFREEGADAGAGNLYEWISYSAEQGEICVSLSLVLHSISPGLAATPPPEFDFEVEALVLEGIVASFDWLNPLPGPTSTPTLEPEAVRLEFEPGEASVSVSGGLDPAESDTYVIYALEEQKMSVELSFDSGEAILVIWGADGQLLLTDSAAVSEFEVVLPKTQDYYIRVAGSPDAATAYTLTVAIEPLPGIGPEPPPQRISFETGETSATVTGALDPAESHLYVLRALGGQTMTVELDFSEGEAILAVWGANGVVLLSDHAEASSAEVVLPSTQDYYILVKGHPDEATEYTLTVTIPPLGGAQ